MKKWWQFWKRGKAAGHKFGFMVDMGDHHSLVTLYAEDEEALMKAMHCLIDGLEPPAPPAPPEIKGFGAILKDGCN